MDSNILEDHDLKNSAEDLFGSLNRSSKVLYNILLILFIACSILMSIIQVPVSAEFRGTLRPASEKKHIYSSVNGTINQIFLEENQKVRSGQIVLIMDYEREAAQLELIENELNKNNDWMRDCDYMVNSKIIELDSIHTARFRAEYILFLNEQSMIRIEMNQAETDLSRYRYLIKDSLISEKELENVEFQYNNHSGKLKSHLHSSIKNWQEQLDVFKHKEFSLLQEKSSLEQAIKESEVKSPVSGTIQGIRNIFPGYFCTAGRALFDVIPDTVLVAEMYIPSDKIGFISPGMKARLKIDAFDYRYWGFIESSCKTISHDYDLIDNQPFFRVICQPEEPYLLRFKGKTMILKPGMTLSSQFVLVNRSVWQLLGDKIDRWIVE